MTLTDDVVKLISTYSSSEVNRKSMIEQLLLEDVLDLDEIELADESDTHNRKILDALMKSLGCILEDD